MNKAEVYSIIDAHYRANFGSLVKKYTNTAGGSVNAEDVIQNMYTRACQYWNTLADKESLDRWLVGILKNCIADHKNDTKMQGMVNIADVEDLLVAPDNPMFKCTINEIEEMISDEPVDHRLILRLHFLQQYGPNDIDKLVGQSNGAIRQIVYRFREKVKARYA